MWVGESKPDLDDGAVSVAVVVVAAAAVVGVVAVVREEKQEPSLSVCVVEYRWIQLPLSDFSRGRIFSKCRRYRRKEMGGDKDSCYGKS